MRVPEMIDYLQAPGLKILRSWTELQNLPMYLSQKSHALGISLAFKGGRFLLLKEEMLQCERG